MTNDQGPMTKGQLLSTRLRSPMNRGRSSIATADHLSCRNAAMRSTDVYDLKERTAHFGEAVIEFCSALPVGPVTVPLITQLVKAGTSIGANYCEADEGESKKDFRHKIGICRKESKETKYWLRMMAKAVAAKSGAAKVLWQEGKELHLIFCAIIRTTDKNLQAEARLRRLPQ
jgi:four helix bundle protein